MNSPNIHLLVMIKVKPSLACELAKLMWERYGLRGTLNKMKTKRTNAHTLSASLSARR